MTAMRPAARRDVPPTPGAHLDVLRIKTEVRTFVCLSTCLRGFDYHWWNKRDRPHYDNKKTCPGCIAKAPLRWKGFLHVTDHALRGQAFLPLTPDGANQLLRDLAPGMKLRGRQFSTRRAKGTINSALMLDLTEIFHPEEKLLAEVDPYQTVMRMWGQI